MISLGFIFTFMYFNNFSYFFQVKLERILGLTVPNNAGFKKIFKQNVLKIILSIFLSCGSKNILPSQGRHIY